LEGQALESIGGTDEITTIRPALQARDTSPW
jgi:hypothetical protein